MECSSIKQVSRLEGSSRFQTLTPVIFGLFIFFFFSMQNSLEQALDSLIPSSWENAWPLSFLLQFNDSAISPGKKKKQNSIN